MLFIVRILVTPNDVLADAAVVAPVPPLPTGSVPITPVVSGNPVKLVATPDVGVPRRGVTSVGEVANTEAPVPVSSVSAASRLAEDGVASAVATFAPRPDTPALMDGCAQVRSPFAAMVVAKLLAAQSAGFAANAVAVAALPVADPLVPVTFPVTLPVSAAVIVPATKFPLPSRATMADAVLALAAVVLAFGSTPVTFAVRSIDPASIALVTVPAGGAYSTHDPAGQM